MIAMHESLKAACSPIPSAQITGAVDAADKTAASTSDIMVWLGIILSGATLAVTCVGVVVAVSAVVGYQAAKRMIKRHAQTHAREQTDAYLKSELFETQLKSVANVLLRDHVRDRITIGLTPGPDNDIKRERTEIEEGT